MCGIAGIVSLASNARLSEEDEQAVRLMTEAMAYRGPDGSGILRHNNICLGHRRLSIIDLAGGAQPMQDAEGRLSIVFNGEIYNYRELRQELQQRGAHFQTHSDTEVLLEAYRVWGRDCLDHLDGMFAFVLWDDVRKCLFGARDRFGKKPLFYTVQNGQFLFASELSCLRKVPGLGLTLDDRALMRYLAYQYVPCPQTMFREILQLPPATALVLKGGELSLWSYWDIPQPSSLVMDEQEACEELRRLMRRAVRRRMIADVPLGVFLSGGIDSSIVTGLMAEASSTPIKSFSIGFHEASYDESGYARLASRAFGTTHYERVFLEEECSDILPSVVSAMDVPVADPSAAPTWLLSRMTRQHVTVALGGDGSDELWAGYEHYAGFAIAQSYNHWPLFLRQCIIEPICRRLPASTGYVNLRLATATFLRAAKLPPWLRIQSMLTACSADMQERLLQHADRDFLRDENLFAPTYRAYHHVIPAEGLDPTFNAYIRGFLLDDILVKVDRCSMLNSLEVRAPFLDRELAEFVLRLPARYKLHGLRRKYLLKKAFADLLPQKILHRNKRGFQIPVSKWLRGRLRPLMEDLLSKDSLSGHGFFNPEEVRRLMDAHLSGQHDLRTPLWTLMVFQLWWRTTMGR
ncbi:MAG TPA: asparagine synthase (glutamine-hydrolyzing) [Candidatus Desulfovibrio intestinipullorum]|uniref:asparagine synthase (glutamine-hydrolyzing) n=1 Tax=Candidatus Desulfovibrio intestinipullorum TaxID=2838536 RepID=A0A9D1PY22_9BACT|nr:asparagine synthase (glutamine-hydrolyzing) [Candidatus Desulfovibrio intestinipullorum]